MPEIDRVTFNEAMRCYWKIGNTLPTKLQENLPNFETFSGASNFGHWYSSLNSLEGKIKLTEQGWKRLEMLKGPYAKALLTAFAAKEGK